MEQYFLHGDVHVVVANEIPVEALPISERVLEYGEVTGHAHRFADDTAQVYQTKAGQKYLRVVSPTDLTHEEHHTKTIPPGIYEIRRTRETDHMEGITRILAD